MDQIATKTILIVEDDDAVRITLVELMELNGFSCISAINGADALKIMQSKTPDLIISDVNMPFMNGTEFTKKIKNLPQYAHIPVIMLTANTADYQLISGLNAGAVDYIKKPFINKELTLKVKNILAIQNKNIKSGWKTILSDSFNLDQAIDEEFIEQLYQIIIKNIESPSYSVSDLATDLNVSERNLYRKLNVNLNMPVASFIREVKLQVAHELIINKRVRSLTEAAYKVGFKSTYHFSRLYKQKY